MLLLACGIVALIVGGYVLLPLFMKSEGGAIDLSTETEADRLLERKSVIYRNIKDLQFEYKMGRLSDSDFQQLEAGYKTEAAEILQMLDQTEKSTSSQAAERRSNSSPRCSQCGSRIVPGKKFCADCGKRIV
jgi:hypothetical protein